jgi:hypothetical protein
MTSVTDSRFKFGTRAFGADGCAKPRVRTGYCIETIYEQEFGGIFAGLLD